MDRLAALRDFVAKSPDDPFPRYGLAMEFVKAGELERAVAEFETVRQKEPSYGAAYYHGGQALEKLGRLDDARKCYQQGVESTRDAHARSELQAALDILGE